MTAESTTVRIDGLAALIKALREAEVELDDLKVANQDAARIVLDEARVLAPHRSGRLAASGRASRAARKASVVFGRAAVPYAAVQEFGWPARNIPANPYGVPAAARTQDQWVGAYERDIERILAAIERST